MNIFSTQNENKADPDNKSIETRFLSQV